MSDKKQSVLLKKLLLHSRNRSRLWAALTALYIGMVLLLFSVMIWWNFQELLYGKGQDDKLGSTFIVIGKQVTNANMGKPQATVFKQEDIDSIAHVPQVQDVGIIASNHFPVYAMMGGNLSFSTDLPLESVPDSFIDKIPEGWKWQPGSNDLPIIISSQFLDMYNYVFAPSQGLPQLSQSSIKLIGLTVKAGPQGAEETFFGHIVGFSDRINSVMVPQSFIDYGNKKFARQGAVFAPSRLILKTKDPSDKVFAGYLESHHYTTNQQNLRWSKMRAIVEVISAATGILAVLLMGIGSLVFILFIELTIAKARHSLTLLIELGYSPKTLGNFMAMQFLPKVLLAAILSMATAASMQAIIAQIAKERSLSLTTLPGLPVWGAWLISLGLLCGLVIRSIRAAVRGND